MRQVVGFKLNANRTFFDREKVIKALDPEFRRDLARLGAYIRRVARNSIKRAKSLTPAARGKPPLSRTRLLKDNIAFAYDFLSRSLVVGPTLLSDHKSPYPVPIPAVLEFGGEFRLSGPMSYFAPAAAASFDAGLGRGRDSRGRFVSTYEFVEYEAGDVVKRHPHPFMGPALEATERSGKLLQFFSEGPSQPQSQLSLLF